MARIVVIGAGFAGQTAALYLGKRLGRKHEITVINSSDQFYFIPSYVWVGTGRMDPKKTHFPLKPVYDRFRIRLHAGRATAVNPVQQTVSALCEDGSETHFGYDYLLIATGPKLNFEATPGLGPGRNSLSICTLGHATEARDAYLEKVERMERGERQRFLIGTGHPLATCQGAAFEYISNIHKDLVRRGLRDKADLHWLSNEADLGDFGIRGISNEGKAELSGNSREFIEAVFNDMGISWEVQRGVTAVDRDRVEWEAYDGSKGETAFDFAMLIPQFTGVPLKVEDTAGNNLHDRLMNPAHFIKVDGIYGLPYDQLEDMPEAWPAVYQNPDYRNIFAAGIAFAPPGPISVPHTNPNGMSITATPPRTGMVSGIIGRVVALNIADLVEKGRMTHQERMSEMAAACIASMGDSLWDGGAATIMIHPVVPNRKKYPGSGRDEFVTHMEMGLAGAWMKRMIHTTS